MLKRYNLNNIFYLVALFILLAVFLIYPLDLNIYWDQSVYLLHGKYFAGFDIGYDELIFRSPFLSLLTAPLWLFTYKIIHFKLISLLFSFYFLFISYLYLKEISKKQIALISVILLFSSGLFHFETRFFLTDIPSLSFFISSLYFTEKKLKNSSNFILAGVFLSLMILTLEAFTSSVFMIKIYHF